MADYIDKAVVDKTLCGFIRELNRAGAGIESSAVFEALARVRYIPAADVREVVLCGDCEYCKKLDEFEYWCYGFCSPARLVRKDDFCSHGKAKE